MFSSDIQVQSRLPAARSYYEHRNSLIYSIHGNTFLSPGGEIFDEAHENRGRIDCSTLVHLYLQGIPYEKSPYATMDPDTFFQNNGVPMTPADHQKMMHADHSSDYLRALKECGSDAEAFRRLFKEGALIRPAFALAHYYDFAGRCHYGDKSWKPGDLVFFQVSKSLREAYLGYGVFHSISHVGIVSEDPAYMYESSGNQTKNVEENPGRPGVQLTPVEGKREVYCYVTPE